MAAKKTQTQRVADLKTRFARIKVAVMAVDALTAGYLDRVADDLEGFATDLQAMTGREEDQASAN